MSATDGVTLIGWGFGVDPDMSDVTFAGPSGNGMIDAVSQDSLPGLSGIEVCVENAGQLQCIEGIPAGPIVNTQQGLAGIRSAQADAKESMERADAQWSH